MSVDANAVIAGRYRLERRIATGGMGEVWSAVDDRLGRAVAVKILKSQYAEDARFLDRFRGEARHMAGLDHPGIARLYDYGEDDGLAFLVMELVDGETLSAVLAREGRLDLDRALDIASQVGYALHAAHEAGVIHRDVKPANILVTSSGTVKVTDFGIARATAAAAVTQTGMVLGTAHYLSPEQASGKPVTPASDVYSLGVVIYECVSGNRPYDGDTPVSIVAAHLYSDAPPLPDDVPAPVVDLLAQAMARDPEERFRSALAFARAAENVRGTPAGDETRALPAAAIDATTVLTTATGPLAVARGRGMSPVARWVTAVTALGVLLFLVLVLSSGDEPPAAPPASRSQTPAARVTTAPPLISVPETLVGDDYEVVAAAVRALGLVPRRADRTSGEEPGTVIEISPRTGLRRGATVTLVVSAGEAKDDDKDDDRDKGRGKGKND